MAGGIFGKPFALNIKCIIFSLIIMALFLYKPNIKSNIVMAFTLFVIFVVSYVSMAWYDAFYDCRVLPLKRGKYGITTFFKPPTHSEKQETHEEDERDVHSKHLLIYISHIIFIVPLLVYIGVYGKKVKPMTYPLVIALSVFTAAYHGIRLTQLFH